MGKYYVSINNTRNTTESKEITNLKILQSAQYHSRDDKEYNL